MVITMLQAQVDDARSGELVRTFRAGSDELPPPIEETFLARGSDDAWIIVTVWRSREALDRYRASVDTPAGVLMFRAAGVEPSLSVFDVEVHARAG